MERKYSIDFLKIVFTVLIIFHHYQQLVVTQFTSFINFYGGKFYFGYLVEFFFILSGFVIVKYIEPIAKGMNFLNFWGKRYLRLISLVALAAITYSFLVFWYHKVGRAPYEWLLLPTEPDLWGTIQTALGMQAGSIFPGRQINNPTWYISILLLCYIVFYLIVRISHNKGISPYYLFIGMIFLGVAIRTNGINLPLMDGSAARGYYTFFWGVILGKIYGERNSTLREVLFGIIIFTATVMFMVQHAEGGVYGWEYLMSFILYPALLVVFNSSFIKKVFCHGFWSVLGSIAFNTYVWHVNVLLGMYVILSALNISVDFKRGYMMLVYTGISFVFGCISHYIIEKPLNRRLFEKCNLIDRAERFFEKV